MYKSRLHGFLEDGFCTGNVPPGDDKVEKTLVQAAGCHVHSTSAMLMNPKDAQLKLEGRTWGKLKAIARPSEHPNQYIYRALLSAHLRDFCSSVCCRVDSGLTTQSTTSPFVGGNFCPFISIEKVAASKIRGRVRQQVCLCSFSVFLIWASQIF